MDTFFDIFKIILPMLVLGGVIYYLFDNFFKQETERRRLELKLKDRDLLTPQRLQAYERMALFLERIRPTHLTRRMDLAATSDAYEFVLVNAIQEEFDHNLSQQIYIHPETWKIIFSAKNATQNFIKQCRETAGKTANPEAFRAEIIRRSLEGNSASNSALLKLQADVQGDSF